MKEFASASKNIDGLVWAEIDDPVDLTFAQTNVFPQLAMAVV
jgi:hypothetical protein